MSIGYGTATGNARLTATFLAAVSGQSVDGGSGDGLFVIGTSALSGATGVLVTFTLAKPSVAIASKVATLAGFPVTATPSANGTAALAEFRDSAGNSIVTGITVGTSGTNVLLSTTTISTSIPITLTSGTITSP